MTSLQALLQETLMASRSKNPSYSLRALARRLDVSPAGLSLILNGRRKPSIKLTEQILDRLGTAPNDRKNILAQPPKRDASQRYDLLQNDQFKLISDWLPFAVLSLLETRGARAQAPWVSRRLGVPLREARGALERLTKLGLLAKDKKGQLKLSGRNVITSDGVSSAAIRENHRQVLQKAESALFAVPVERRDFTNLTMAIDPKSLPEATALVRDFRERMSALLEKGDRTQVYNLAIQLFPLSEEK